MSTNQSGSQSNSKEWVTPELVNLYVPATTMSGPIVQSEEFFVTSPTNPTIQIPFAGPVTPPSPGVS